MTGWRYTIYGLQLQTNQPIPGLNTISANHMADVQVWFGEWPDRNTMVLDELPPPTYMSAAQDIGGDSAWAYWDSIGINCCRLRFADGVDFIVHRNGDKVWITWPDDLTLDYVIPYLLGSVMGLVLRLRGIMGLHGGAVAVDNQALALVGPSGTGKSTALGMFALRGNAILCDDIVALKEQNNRLMAQPAYPRLRLRPQSIPILYNNLVDLPKLAPGWDKHVLDLSKSGLHFQEQALPLKAVYFLDERSSKPNAPYIEPVEVSNGLIELLGNAYASHLLDRSGHAREFEALSHIAQLIPLRRVIPAADPAKLPQLCDLIIEDFRSLTSTMEQSTRHV